MLLQGQVRWDEFYRVLERHERRTGGAAAWSGARLWETDPAVRAALDQLVEELWDRREDVRSMFERLDRNGTGVLSRQEMLRAMKQLGVRLGPSELTAVMRAFDQNGDVRLLAAAFVEEREWSAA